MNNIENNEGFETDAEKRLNEEKSRIKMAKLSMAIQDVMSLSTGRHFIWHLIEQFKVYDDGYDDNPVRLARNSGVKGSGLYILNLILSKTPEKYDLMIKEHRIEDD